jgi:putative transposase
MVSHPAEYLWYCYHGNALYKHIEFLTSHDCYLSLGNTSRLRKTNYLALVKEHIPKHLLEDIRDAINKMWVLGDNRFKQQIEEQTGRRASPLQRGGDRQSQLYKRVVGDQ